MEPTKLDVNELIEARKQLTNIFALLYKSKFEGGQSETVLNALRWVDVEVGKLNKTINELQPVKVNNEPSTAVEATAAEPVAQ